MEKEISEFDLGAATRKNGFSGRLWVATILFVGFVFLEALVVGYSGGFDVIDDHLFLGSLCAGHALLGPNVDLSHGRFAPINGTAYNAFLIFAPHITSSILHAWNALEAMLFAGLLVQLLRLEVPERLALLGSAMFLFLPGFATAVNRLLVPEREACVAIAIMLLSYRHSNKRWWRVTCFFAANAAIYSKEPVAGAILVFSSCQIYMGRRKRGPLKDIDHNLAIDLLLAASAIAFFAIYAAISSTSAHDMSYVSARRFLPFAANVAQNIRGYTLFSDPFLMMIAFPLAFARAWKSIRQPFAYRGATDAALFAGVAYAMAIFALNMSYTDYYLLPAACLVWPALCGSAAQFLEIRPTLPWIASFAALCLALALSTQVAGGFVIPAALLSLSALFMFGNLQLRNRAGALALCIAFLTFGLNSLCGSISSAWLLKVRPAAYSAILDQLALRLRANPAQGRTNIFITGMTAASGIESFISLEANLKFRGLSSAEYDLVSSTSLDGVFERDSTSAFTVFRDPRYRSPRQNDLIITPPAVATPNGVTLLAEVQVPTLKVFGLDLAIQSIKRKYIKHKIPVALPMRFSLGIEN